MSTNRRLCVVVSSEPPHLSVFFDRVYPRAICLTRKANSRSDGAGTRGQPCDAAPLSRYSHQSDTHLTTARGSLFSALNGLGSPVSFGVKRVAPDGMTLAVYGSA